MKTLTSRQQYWAELIAEWQLSGLSQIEFCRTRKLDIKAFYNWKSTLKKVQAPSEPRASGKFLPITLSEEPASIVVSIYQAKLQFDAATDEQLFLKLVRLLKEAT